MRKRLLDRRLAHTIKIKWNKTGGPDHKLLVTFGLDENKMIKEAFIAAFRADSSFSALVNDACILYSRLLQHGESVEELAATMGEDRNEGSRHGPPSSMLGAIARAAVEVQRSFSSIKSKV
jgi:hypothetical protein